MREILANLYRTLNTNQPQQERPLDGLSVKQVIPDQPPNGLFPITFDDLLCALRDRAELFVEPDGSFSIGGRIRNLDWSCGGMVYDAGESVAYVEFRGIAPVAMWRTILDAIRHVTPSEEEGEYLFYLKAEGVFLTIDDFLSWLNQLENLA